MTSPAVLKVVAEPRRQAILRLVWNAERPAGEIASHFDISHAAVSQHLKVLKEAGLVNERRNGRYRYYRASPEQLGPLKPALEEFWRTALQQLKDVAEAKEGKRNGKPTGRG